MKKIIDGACLDEESKNNEIKAISEMQGYWDIEDLLYEQYKEMKMEGFLDDLQGKMKIEKLTFKNSKAWIAIYSKDGEYLGTWHVVNPAFVGVLQTQHPKNITIW